MEHAFRQAFQRRLRQGIFHANAEPRSKPKGSCAGLHPYRPARPLPGKAQFSSVIFAALIRAPQRAGSSATIFSKSLPYVPVGL